jgi:class 3 adenylate cyclase
MMMTSLLVSSLLGMKASSRPLQVLQVLQVSETSTSTLVVAGQVPHWLPRADKFGALTVSFGTTPTPTQNAITFVVTDVAGSTELWEWNAEVMDLALQLHDGTLRTLLFQHKGHEVATEGDSFTVVFHDATDALQWCLKVQQASARIVTWSLYLQ